MSRIRISAHDLMDGAEVAEAFGVKASSVNVALSSPHNYPSLAAQLPAPLRRVGNAWVWLRSDVEAAVKAAAKVAS
jgi:hypothetical protein